MSVFSRSETGHKDTTGVLRGFCFFFNKTSSFDLPDSLHFLFPFLPRSYSSAAVTSKPVFVSLCLEQPAFTVNALGRKRWLPHGVRARDLVRFYRLELAVEQTHPAQTTQTCWAHQLHVNAEASQEHGWRRRSEFPERKLRAIQSTGAEVSYELPYSATDLIIFACRSKHICYTDLLVCYYLNYVSTRKMHTLLPCSFPHLFPLSYRAPKRAHLAPCYSISMDAFSLRPPALGLFAQSVGAAWGWCRGQ